MIKMVIMRGISGSGKSTFVETSCKALGYHQDNSKMGGRQAYKVFSREGANDIVVCSADFWHITDGEYRFDVRNLSTAHRECFRAALRALERGSDVVIDNTNTQLDEMSPYVALAGAFDARLHFVHMTVDVDVAAARNVHSVDTRTVENQYRRFDSVRPYWIQRHAYASEIFTNPTPEVVAYWAESVFLH